MGIYAGTFDKGFIKTKRNKKKPVIIKRKDKFINKPFTSVRNGPTLAKLIPATTINL